MLIPLIYVAGAYKGDTVANTAKAEEVSIALIRNKWNVFTPHKFFAKQPQHIQDMVLLMSEDHTVADVLAHLETLGIYPTPDQLGHFRRKHSKSSGRHPATIPEDTFDERVWQYISAIPQHHGYTWANSNLGFKGQIWTRCSTKLCDANLIEMIAIRPARYKMIVPYDEMIKWYDR